MPTTTPTPAPGGLAAERLREIRERLAKATPGPYAVCDEREWYEHDEGDLLVMGAPTPPNSYAFPVARIVMSGASPADDAALIAHAPQDIADLLAALAAATAALASAERDAARWRFVLPLLGDAVKAQHYEDVGHGEMYLPIGQHALRTGRTHGLMSELVCAAVDAARARSAAAPDREARHAAD